MNESENTPPTLQPLNNLMKVPRGRINIDVDPAILPKLDLATLEHILHFRISLNPEVKVALRNYGNRVSCMLTMRTEPSHWPGIGNYDVLFATVVATAAEVVVARTPNKRFGSFYSERKGAETMIHYELPLPLKDGNILQRLQNELQKVLKELPAVFNVLAHGPQPGRIPDPEPIEEADDENFVDDINED